MKSKIRKVHRKLSKYFFEFLMLFLAVVLGFITENYRENKQNHRLANNYLLQLTVDLNKDITNGNSALKDWREKRIPYFDSIANNYSEIINDDYNRFKSISNRYNSYADFYPTSSAYDQIKNLGFRYIESPALIDSIQNYYSEMDNILGEMDITSMKYTNMWNSGHMLISLLKADSLNSIEESFKTRSVFYDNASNNVYHYYNKIRVARFGLMINEYFLNKQLIKGENLIKIINDYLEEY